MEIIDIYLYIQYLHSCGQERIVIFAYLNKQEQGPLLALKRLCLIIFKKTSHQIFV